MDMVYRKEKDRIRIQIEAQRSGFDLGKEEGLSGCVVFAALSQTAETERS